MWIVGGEVYGWYETDLRLGSLRVTIWDVYRQDAEKLEQVARTKAGALGVAGSYIFTVFAGDVWAWAYFPPMKLLVTGETHSSNPFRTLMHEFGHNLGLPDLYNYQNLDAEPVGEWDLMDSGEEELSGWSRMKLGWLPSGSIVNTYSTRDLTVSINSLESTSGTRLVKIQLSGSLKYLLAETRETDQELRLVVYRIEGAIESGKGSIVLEAVMSPSDEAVFYDEKIGAGFIILELQSDGLRVKLVREAESQKAQGAFDVIKAASESIDDAWSSNRVQGLQDAKEELNKAWDSHKGHFDAAKSFADRAEELAQSAKTPESYSKALELKQTLTAWIESVSLKSEEAIRYVTFAKALIQEANDLIDKKDFDTALQKLLEAQQDLQKAAEAEKTSTEVISVPAFNNLPIIVGTVGAIVVGVVALLLMRRKTRTARAATAVVSPAQPAPSVGPLAAGKFCINCGAPLPAHAAVCETCGSMQ